MPCVCLQTSRDFRRGTHSMKASYILLFFALFFTISLWNVARSWKGSNQRTTCFTHSVTYSTMLRRMKVIFFCQTHQAPQGSILCRHDCGGSRRVVHESQLSKTALVVIFSNTNAHTVLLYKNIVDTSGSDWTEKEREQMWIASPLYILVNYGVPQGSILGPILFTLCIYYTLGTIIRRHSIHVE